MERRGTQITERKNERNTLRTVVEMAFFAVFAYLTFFPQKFG